MTRWRRSRGARRRCGSWSGSWPGGGFRCGEDAVARICARPATACRRCRRCWRAASTRTGTPSSVMLTGGSRSSGRPGIRWSAWTRRRRSSSAPSPPGRSWRPGGDPVRVRDHDFADRGAGHDRPLRDLRHRREPGVRVGGTSHDTAAFAVAALRLWWQREGALRYPGARRLLVACDAGGSNGYRCRLWKDQLAVSRRDGPGDQRRATSRPAPASGTRSSTGCSATSPAPGAPGR